MPRPLPAGFRFQAAVLSAFVLLAAAPAERNPLAFEVTYAPELQPGPISARVGVMLGSESNPETEPRRGPN